jgi:hypothetical protein
MRYPSTPWGQATPEMALQPLQRWLTRRAGGLQPSSTPLYTPSRTPLRARRPGHAPAHAVEARRGQSISFRASVHKHLSSIESSHGSMSHTTVFINSPLAPTSRQQMLPYVNRKRLGHRSFWSKAGVLNLLLTTNYFFYFQTNEDLPA